MKLNVKKLERALIAEENILVRMFNNCYAGSRQTGADAMKALILEAKIEVYKTIINAVQDATEE